MNIPAPKSAEFAVNVQLVNPELDAESYNPPPLLAAEFESNRQPVNRVLDRLAYMAPPESLIITEWGIVNLTAYVKH